MAIYPIRRQAFHQAFGDFEKELSRLFERSQDFSGLETSTWFPSIDIKEEQNQFVIHVDVPGMKSEDIQVKVDNRRLVIQGERQSEQKEDKTGYVRIERARGSFYRSVELPDTANIDHIDAKYEQGVLTILIPKREKSNERRIEVKTNGNNRS